MKRKKTIAAAVLAGALGLAALGGCSEPMADTGATYNPGEPPLMPASHEGRYERLGANGCYGCHGSSDTAEVLLRWAPPRPPPPFGGAHAATRAIDGPRAECITCHPVSQE